MVLASFAAEIEVAAAYRGGNAEDSDGEQLLQPATDALPTGKRGQMRLGERVLLFGPAAGLGIIAVLEPTIRVGDFLAVDYLG
jgi:hypothetical protein